MLSDPLTDYGIRGAYKMTKDYLTGGAENCRVSHMPAFEEFAEIYGKMAINGFEICDEWGHNRYILE